jgi:geranylgeranylglycerol-phosphate geranylgeranyltransferase
MNKILAILRLTRIEHSVMLVIAVIAAELIASGGKIPSLVILAASLITPIFISMSSFAINDYFDVEVDRSNKKGRPIVSGAISRDDALWIAIATLAIGIASSALINVYCLLIAIIFGSLAMLYSYKLKEMLFIGNAYIGLSMAIPFIFGNYVADTSINESILLVSFMIFLSGLAREIHGTIRDYHGDTKIRNAKTIPAVIGKEGAAIMAMVLYAVAILISIYLFILVVPFKHNFIYAIMVGLSDLLLGYVSVGYLIKKSARFYAKTRNMSLAAMALALLSFIIVAL